MNVWLDHRPALAVTLPAELVARLSPRLARPPFSLARPTAMLHVASPKASRKARGAKKRRHGGGGGSGGGGGGDGGASSSGGAGSGAAAAAAGSAEDGSGGGGGGGGGGGEAQLVLHSWTIAQESEGECTLHVRLAAAKLAQAAAGGSVVLDFDPGDATVSEVAAVT